MSKRKVGQRNRLQAAASHGEFGTQVEHVRPECRSYGGLVNFQYEYDPRAQFGCEHHCRVLLIDLSTYVTQLTFSIPDPPMKLLQRVSCHCGISDT